MSGEADNGSDAKAGKPDKGSKTVGVLGRMAVLGAGAGVLAWLLAGLHPQRQAVAAGVRALGWEQAQALSPSPLWIDARSRAEFEAGHVPGAVWVSEEDWQGGLIRLAPLLRAGHPLVVYCRSASCASSARVAQRLRRDLDWQEVFVLRGGWEEKKQR
jgi:rhodanese-related sulfurtransferase